VLKAINFFKSFSKKKNKPKNPIVKQEKKKTI